MKPETQTGGQAFPGGTAFSSPGMTLRDWFAGMAMLGFYTCPDQVSFGDGSLLSAVRTNEEIARASYEQADAMLAARGDA